MCERIIFFLVERLGTGLIYLWLFTVRIKIDGREHETALIHQGQALIYGFWHNSILIAAFSHRHRGIHAMISLSRDGEYISRIVRRLGSHPIRGSSSRRGAMALREIVSALVRGNHAAFTPDGPRGPRHRVQSGIVLASSLSGSPILPVGIAVNRCWRLPSWDRFIIPQPFSTALIMMGPPYQVPPELSPEQVRHHCQQLQLLMIKLLRQCRQRVRSTELEKGMRR